MGRVIGENLPLAVGVGVSVLPIIANLAGVSSGGPSTASNVLKIILGVNPKNLILIIAAAATIAQSGISIAQQVGALVVFVAIGTIGVALPLIVYFAMEKRAEEILSAWKGWLAANNSAVMSVLFLVFAAVLIGKGIAGLT